MNHRLSLLQVFIVEGESYELITFSDGVHEIKYFLMQLTFLASKLNEICTKLVREIRAVTLSRPESQNTQYICYFWFK